MCVCVYIYIYAYLSLSLSLSLLHTHKPRADTHMHTRTDTQTHGANLRNHKQRALPFIAIIRHLKPHRQLLQNLVGVSSPARRCIRIGGRFRTRICTLILTRRVHAVAVCCNSVGVSRSLRRGRHQMDALVVVYSSDLLGCGLAVYSAAGCTQCARDAK